ncbi:MAG: hypothetical protein LBP51_04320 [Deferribacteraceae bacterium]|jgi:hypothetical protein|nr:hypothetical protein [Deferribacteraceae bacterium]
MRAFLFIKNIPIIRETRIITAESERREYTPIIASNVAITATDITADATPQKMDLNGCSSVSTRKKREISRQQKAIKDRANTILKAVSNLPE